MATPVDTTTAEGGVLHSNTDKADVHDHTDASSASSAAVSGVHKAPPTATEAAQMFVFSAPKAGMKDVDTAHVQSVVFEMSKDSLFFQNSIKQNDKVDKRIADMRLKVSTSLTSARRETLRRQIDAAVAKMETTRDLTRTKVVVDMDMFYAAVEMRDAPHLREKPLAVGGMGMLSTTNYVARKFGVRAAMPGFIGKELCPDLVIVPPNFDKYTHISSQIREIVAQYDPQFRAMSLDEVYCDITQFMEDNWTRYVATGSTRRSSFESEEEEEEEEEEERGEEPWSDEFVGASEEEKGEEEDEEDEDRQNVFEALAGGGRAQKKRRRDASVAVSRVPPRQREAVAAAVVNEIRQKIYETTQLTASAGIAANTMLAKICSDVNKPNGQYVLPFTREAVLGFVETLPVRKIGGIGKVMEKTLGGALEITMAKHLYEKRVEIFHLFSERTASWLLRISRGLQGSADGETSAADYERKGYSRERTFSAKGISDPQWLEKICLELCERLAVDLQEGGHGCKTVTLKLKCVDFSLRTRAVSSSRTLQSCDDLFAYAKELLRKELPLNLRLMGVRASALVQTMENGEDGGRDGTKLRKRQIVMDEFTSASRSLEDLSGGGSSAEEGVEMDGGGSEGSSRQLLVQKPRQHGIQAFMTATESVSNPFAQAAALSQTRSEAHPTQALFRKHSKEKARDQVASVETFQPCPICGKKINAGNAIAIELHVDACLRRGGSNPKRTIHQFFAR